MPINAKLLELSGNKDPEIVLAEARGARRCLREISRQLALSSPPTVNVAYRTAWGGSGGSPKTGSL